MGELNDKIEKEKLHVDPKEDCDRADFVRDVDNLMSEEDLWKP